MPLLFNLDHQHAIHGDGTATAPGDSHEFTEQEVRAGLTGAWSNTDPRAGLAAEKEFKKRRDAHVKPSPSPDKQTPEASAESEPDPADTGEKE